MSGSRTIPGSTAAKRRRRHRHLDELELDLPAGDRVAGVIEPVDAPRIRTSRSPPARPRTARSTATRACARGSSGCDTGGGWRPGRARSPRRRGGHRAGGPRARPGSGRRCAPDPSTSRTAPRPPVPATPCASPGAAAASPGLPAARAASRHSRSGGSWCTRAAPIGAALHVHRVEVTLVALQRDVAGDVTAHAARALQHGGDLRERLPAALGAGRPGPRTGTGAGPACDDGEARRDEPRGARHGLVLQHHGLVLQRHGLALRRHGFGAPRDEPRGARHGLALRRHGLALPAWAARWMARRIR